MKVLRCFLSILFSYVVCLCTNGTTEAAQARTPEQSLARCQIVVAEQTTKFIEDKLNAIGACLKEVTKEIVEKNNLNPAGAADICITEFRKLGDTRPGQSVEIKLAAEITNSCDPETNMYSLEDLLGTGNPGVAESLNVSNINDYCATFGGDGNIDTLYEWINCIVAASECAADTSIAAQHPRALEWMYRVRPYMEAQSPPSDDPSQITDALAGLDMVYAAVDGTPAGDFKPNIQCISMGGPAPVCGNSVVEGSEQCDDGNLTNGDGCSDTCTLESCVPSAEICDGLDNDCDGQVDEDFLLLGQSCTAGTGICARPGFNVCRPDGSGVLCSATSGTPGTEICGDGLDNDCDGATDEAECSKTLGSSCASANECLSGFCVDGYCSNTICDGICESTNQPGQLGLCTPLPSGTACGSGLVCNGNGSCVAACIPQTEICDGIDNDCDGQTDEGCTCAAGDSQSCSTICGTTGTQTCSTSGSWEACIPPAEICDGVDNNCDGQVDEGVSNLHSNGLGQTWTDCVPLGTYNQTQATRACEAWAGDGNCTNYDSQCSGASVVCGQWTDQYACWGYTGAIAGYVHTSNVGPLCPRGGDLQWN